ncbi:MAG: DUF86 domain-containing protein [Bacilli bacterium]|nr:DUF86 domain-containing protein [Bacilli bacterium]
MVDSKTRGILINVIKHCKRIEDKIKNVDEISFYNNDDVKEIVCFNIIQIGELIKKINNDFLMKYTKMPWSNIKGMRDWVAHGYGTIDFIKVWNTALFDIGPLGDYCIEILQEE